VSQSNKPNMPNLPGFDAMADTFEFVKNMWGGMQSPSGIPGMTMPTLSVEEINKQIADLKAVESWLNVNMNMLRGTIQALEVQSATITTLNAMGATFGAQMKPDAAPSSTQNTTSSAPPADVFTQNAKPAADSNTSHANVAEDAATAWWSALQTQFNQVVSSVMADEASAKQKKASPAKPAPKAATTAAKKTAPKSGVSTAQKKTRAAAKTAAKTAVKKRAPSAKS